MTWKGQRQHTKETFNREERLSHLCQVGGNTEDKCWEFFISTYLINPDETKIKIAFNW